VDARVKPGHDKLREYLLLRSLDAAVA